MKNYIFCVFVLFVMTGQVAGQCRQTTWSPACTGNGGQIIELQHFILPEAQVFRKFTAPQNETDYARSPLRDLLGDGIRVPGLVRADKGPYSEGAMPCPGDVVKDPNVAPSGGWNFKGGTYGYTRSSGKQFHNGLDIEAQEGTFLYATHSGIITRIVNTLDRNYIQDSYGNLVEIEFKIGADTYKLMYGHLNEVESVLEVGRFISYGTYIGKSGISGNAGMKQGIPQEDVVPHVHIKASKNGKPYDPELLMKRKYDKQTGQPISDPENDPCK